MNKKDLSDCDHLEQQLTTSYGQAENSSRQPQRH